MEELVFQTVTAFWLGILTSISPCPLASNIAAISFLGRRVKTPRHVFWGGLLYTAGRTVAYVILSIVLITGVLAVPKVSWFLQRYMNQLLGPALILIGMILAGLMTVRTPGWGRSTNWVQQRVETGGFGSELLLGIVLALSFCPISAALFFGSLIPLAIQSRSAAFLPFFYGVGTATPVVMFSLLIAFGVHHVGKAFHGMQALERWARPATGTLFICVGIYMSIRYIYMG